MAKEISTIQRHDKKGIAIGLSSFIILATIINLPGCASDYVVGDWFSVIAELENEQGKQLNHCEIALQNSRGKTIVAASSIPGKFHKIFKVPHNIMCYEVIIYCSGYKPYKNTVLYRVDVSPVLPLKIGIVTMEKAVYLSY